MTWIFIGSSINTAPTFVCPIFSASQLSHSFPQLFGLRAKWHWLLQQIQRALKRLLSLFLLHLALWQCLPLSSSLSHTYTISILVNTHPNTRAPVSDFLIGTPFTPDMTSSCKNRVYIMQVVMQVIQQHGGSWVVLFKCLKTFHPVSPGWKTVLVLVGKWCGTSWGAVSFSWVVFVWPFKGSPPVAIATRKSINGGGDSE